MGEAAPRCERCESILHLIIRADGKKSLSCGTCGSDGLGCFQSYSHDEIAGPDQDEGGRRFAFNVNNPTSRGHRHGIHIAEQVTTKARKKASELIERMCQQFKIMSPDLKKSMETLLKVTKFRPLEAGACGVFLVITRQSYDRREISDQITQHQVSSYAEVDISLVNSAISYVENLLPTKDKESARKGAVFGAGATIPLPKFEVRDPITHGDATNRVKTLADRIIQTLLKLTSHSLEPNCTAIAAASLGYQSCYFYQKAYLENIPDEKIHLPSTMSSLEEFVKIVGANNILNKVRKSARLIETEFKRLTDKMVWLQREPRETFKRFLARNLEMILKHEKDVCRAVLAESDAARKKEPVITHVPPRELTKEEEAVLDSPELSEKDLPEHEFRSYLLNDDVRKYKEAELKKVMIQGEEEQEKRALKRKQVNQGGVKKRSKRIIEPAVKLMTDESTKNVKCEDAFPDNGDAENQDEQIYDEEEEIDSDEGWEPEEEQFDDY